MTDRASAYLIADAAEAAKSMAGFSQALAAARPASVLLRASGAALTADLVKACQTAGAAALVENDAALALILGADGVHLSLQGGDEERSKRQAEARALLGAGRIVGVSCGLSRHDAMTAAEGGADYVAFDRPPGAEWEAALDHIAWWAEAFEPPCVAWGAESAEMAAALSQAGADFVAAGPLGGYGEALAVLAGIGKPEPRR